MDGDHKSTRLPQKEAETATDQAEGNSNHTVHPQSQNAPNSATPHELSDRYTVIRKLGQGSQGAVFEAIDQTDGKHVAIKQLRIDSI